MPSAILDTLKSNVGRIGVEPEQALFALRALYAEDLRYENPIQRVQGREPFFKLMNHMATRWAPFSMVIDEGLESTERIYGRFQLSFKPGFLGRTLHIEGVTRCVLDQGLIVEQRDYYDVVSTALDAVPLAGPAFRKIIAQFTIT